MSDAAAEAFVHSQRILLDAEIRQETSVHLQTPCNFVVSPWAMA